jgi:hypothetical protein
VPIQAKRRRCRRGPWLALACKSGSGFERFMRPLRDSGRRRAGRGCI